MPKYALVDPNNVVINIIVWDESSDWRPPEGHIIVNAEEVFCDIGWHHKDGAFEKPPEPEVPADSPVAPPVA